MRILLIEDDVELARRTADGLARDGFVVETTGDGEDGHFMGQHDQFDAAILDLGLPGLSGSEILRRWRASGVMLPVLILTARGGWTDRVEGLNAGADDYMGKPFHLPELSARLHALIRRGAGRADAVLTVGDVALDPTASTATLSGQPLPLTAFEYRLLHYLMHRRGRIVSQSELVDHLYNLESGKESNTIEVYVARLRKKIGGDFITTVRGLGYRVG